MSLKEPKNERVIGLGIGKPAFEIAMPTYMDAWYDRLEDETIVSYFIPLDDDEVKALLTIGEIGEVYDFPEIKERTRGLLKRVEEKVAPVLRNLGGKAFFRLASRSPKDSWHGITRRDLPYFENKGLVLKADDVISWIADSERMHDDLAGALHSKYKMHVVLREWISFKKHEEFRCFIVDRKLKGISQYFYRDFFPELVNDPKKYEEAIIAYFERVREKIPLDDCVMDVVFINDTPKILELNPLYVLTDPCLFNWKVDAFETLELRYLTESLPKEKSFLLELLTREDN